MPRASWNPPDRSRPSRLPNPIAPSGACRLSRATVGHHRCTGVTKERDPRRSWMPRTHTWPGSRWSSSNLRDVMHRRHAIDRRRDAFHARLQLQGQELRIVARLVEIAAVEPQRLLVGRLPHVAQLAFPRARILARIGAEAPAFPDLVGHLLADELSRPAVHRTIAGGEHDQVGRQFAAVAEGDRMLLDALDE